MAEGGEQLVSPEKKEYSRADFDREVEEYFVSLPENLREIAGRSIESKQAAFLNNLCANFPAGSHRGLLELAKKRSGNNEEVRAQIEKTESLFSGVDSYLESLHMSGDEKAALTESALQGEKIAITIDTYIALRSKGYSHQELTQ